MFKSVALIKRKPGITQEEFIRHYEEVHAPLAIQFFQGCFKRYVRNHVTAALGNDPPDFDVISEFWVEDENALARIAELNSSPAAQILRDDEATFMDASKTVTYIVDERVSSI